jgi:hypothetical protein
MELRRSRRAAKESLPSTFELGVKVRIAIETPFDHRSMFQQGGDQQMRAAAA